MQKIALIGAGAMARVHGEAYANIENARVVSVVDSCAEAAEKLAASLGVVAFTSFDDMMSSESPDLVDICTPTFTHKEYVQKCAAFGKHAIVEKPMARTVEDCKEIISAVNRAGITLMVAQVLRFFPEYAAAKRMVESGAVGNPAVVRISRGGGHPGGWYADLDQGGGILMDFMVHDFDWLQWTFGEAERVYARILKARGVDSIEYALVTIRFKSGMIAHVNGNWAYPIKGFQSEFEIAGDMGLLSFDSLCQSSMSVYTKPGEGRSVLVPSDYAYKEDPYFLELKHFVDCMEKGDKPMVTPEDGMRAVRLGQAALESALTGHSIELGNYKI